MLRNVGYVYPRPGGFLQGSLAAAARRRSAVPTSAPGTSPRSGVAPTASTPITSATDQTTHEQQIEHREASYAQQRLNGGGRSPDADRGQSAPAARRDLRRQPVEVVVWRAATPISRTEARGAEQRPPPPAAADLRDDGRKGARERHGAERDRGQQRADQRQQQRDHRRRPTPPRRAAPARGARGACRARRHRGRRRRRWRRAGARTGSPCRLPSGRASRPAIRAPASGTGQTQTRGASASGRATRGPGSSWIQVSSSSVRASQGRRRRACRRPRRASRAASRAGRAMRAALVRAGPQRLVDAGGEARG